MVWDHLGTQCVWNDQRRNLHRPVARVVEECKSPTVGITSNDRSPVLIRFLTWQVSSSPYLTGLPLVFIASLSMGCFPFRKPSHTCHIYFFLTSAGSECIGLVVSWKKLATADVTCWIFMICLTRAQIVIGLRFLWIFMSCGRVVMHYPMVCSPFRLALLDWLTLCKSASYTIVNDPCVECSWMGSLLY